MPGLGDPEEIMLWEHVHPRKIADEDWHRFEGYVAEIFQALGMDLATSGTRDTPRRFLRAMVDSTVGYDGDHKLLTAFPTECRGGPDCRISQIIEGPISFFALCEHHALPFYGVAHVGYIAHERIIGISKLTRLVRLFARRFTVQERVGQEVADHLVELMRPHGVAVHLEATHLCTQMRGVREEQSRTWTSFWRGAYEEDPRLRDEFFRAVRRG
jgi:GTP cyclohydrolase I